MKIRGGRSPGQRKSADPNSDPAPGTASIFRAIGFQFDKFRHNRRNLVCAGPQGNKGRDLGTEIGADSPA